MPSSSYAEPRSPIDIFKVAMDRRLPSFRTGDLAGSYKLRSLNLGAGRKEIVGAIPYDADRGWWAGQPIPHMDGSISVIHAYHFFEHLTKEELIATLRECERVLAPGGVINSVTPHWSAEIAHQDLDHKLFFTEQTWQNLLNNDYYDGTMPRDLKFEVGFQLIMGLVQRNLVLLTQLVRKHV